jgi:hypothetical protein
MVPLVQAAHMAGLDYQRLRLSVIRRECEGRQIGRFWVVNIADVFRLKADTGKASK